MDVAELAALLGGAYPALVPVIEAWPEDVAAVARGIRTPRDNKTYRRLASPLVGDLTNAEGVRRGLRIFARREKMRVAARELLSNAGSDVNVTARELSDLADVCMSIALTEALGWATSRFGAPIHEGDAADTTRRVGFAVIGMGKLGGRELNAGSDVDLMLFYETDEGRVVKDGETGPQTLHEYFARVAQRFIATLEEATEDGIVWRVDMRLRPEGSRGPLVNALASTERYYETWGRTWERAALVRARPCAGDLAFGKLLLDALAPFVWRRAVDPRIAGEMIALVTRARAESDTDPAYDLKLGPGGIREAEFFVQSLQLIWGGRDPSVRSANTLDALRKLRARGLVTDREGREMADAYLVLRRLEHRVQFATGLQTHSLPAGGDLLERIARSLGLGSGQELLRDLERTRSNVSARLATLVDTSNAGEAGDADQGGQGPKASALQKLDAALDDADEAGVLAWLSTQPLATVSPDLARHLLVLARRPDSLLGATTRDRFPELAPVLLAALLDAADPEQAARFTATLFARLATPTVYARALADDPRATRRLAGLFGASAFLGEAIVGHPELADRLLFGRGAPDPEASKRAIGDEVTALGPTPDLDDFVGALRRAKGRVLMEVGLADLAGDLSTRGCTLALSALADATLEEACRFALREKGMGAGLAVIAMGKLGGREIGYGSDLDLFFVYDEARIAHDDAAERFIRIAQRVLRIVGAPHGDGSGYELDTRLRPSGNQGLLVVSRDAFARYHAALVSDGENAEAPERESRPQISQAADWERQALLKARFCAGDAGLGAEIIAIAEEAAYERGAPPPERIHHLRMRMERELAGERRDVGKTGGRASKARYDLKLGRGGIVDVEFAVQWLQMKHGKDPRVRSTETETALGALEACGYLDLTLGGQLREGYRFLRRLEQRLRVLHGTSAHLLEEGAPGLAPLARRMGMRAGPREDLAAALLARYAVATEEVRAAYLTVLGLPAT